jgi:hypothetical protein
MNKKQIAVIMLTLIVIVIAVFLMPKKYITRFDDGTAHMWYFPLMPKNFSFLDIVLPLEAKSVIISCLITGIVLFLYYKDKGWKVNKKQLLICLASIAIILSALLFIPKNIIWHLNNGEEIVSGESMGGYNLYKNKPIPPYEYVVLRREAKVIITIVLMLGTILIIKARNKQA